MECIFVNVLVGLGIFLSLNRHLTRIEKKLGVTDQDKIDEAFAKVEANKKKLAGLQ